MSVPAGARAAVVTVSDRVSRGEREDRGGPLAAEQLRALGFQVGDVTVVPDEVIAIQDAVLRALDEADLVVTTGGTGLSPRDVTVEAVRPLLEREVPGIAEALRAAGRETVPTSILSRSVAGTAGRSLVVTLPGSTGGVRDGMQVLAAVAGHALDQLRGGDHPAP
jgi:molybdenum cofactor biosynthesis protein B